MKPLSKLLYLALLFSLFFLPSPVQADEVLINFEDQPVQSTTQLIVNTPKLSITVSRQGSSFEIEVPQAGSFGDRTLSPGADSSSAKFIADFSAPVSSVTFEIGDQAADFDSLVVTAYSEPGATGDALKTETIVCCGTGIPGFNSGVADFNSDTITLTAPGIKSIEFIGGSPFSPNSVFYDNFTLTVENQVVDLDHDGIPDDVDSCKNSDLSENVVIDGCDTETPNITWYDSGCTTSDYVTVCANNAKNHGHFVTCVKEFSKSMVDNGFVTRDHKDSIHVCAAHARLP